MLNSMLSPFKKKNFPPFQKNNYANKQQNAQKTEQHEQKTEYLSIEYEDESTNQTSILYIMPKPKQLYYEANDDCNIIKREEKKQEEEEEQLDIEGKQNKVKNYQKPVKIFHPQDWNISRFEIGRPLGRGKFGHVYLARERVTKHIVAIKVLSKKQIVNSDVVSQIRRQIQIHTHLNHPNVLKMFGFFFDKRKIYYIMQYAPGGQLYKLLKKQKKFSEKKVARYIKQMASALKYIHKCNVFHRDIKPENILVCDNDQLKISDFGWSVRALTTKRRTMCGTIDYLCPQIIQHKHYDHSVDIWALGILTYELATGDAPFYNKDRQIQYMNVRSVRFGYPNYLSEGIKDFISSLLKKDPRQRMTLEEALSHPWLVHNSQQN